MGQKQRCDAKSFYSQSITIQSLRKEDVLPQEGEASEQWMMDSSELREARRCPTISSLPSPSLWRPWVSLDYFGVFWCWVQASNEALLGCCIILGVAYAAVRGGVYQGTTFQAPLLKLGIGLGLICGLAG